MDSGQNASGQGVIVGGTSNLVGSESQNVLGRVSGNSQSFSRSVPQGIIAGSGDVVLTPEKKPKKGLVIALVVTLLLVLVGLVVGAILLNTNKKDKASDAVQLSDNTKSAFNRYANYLFYGLEEAKDFSWTDGWSLVSALGSATRNLDRQYRLDYFEKAESLRTQFTDLINNEYPERAEDGDWGEFWFAVDGAAKIMGTLKEFVAVEQLTPNVVQEMVLREGLLPTKTMITKRYEGLAKTDEIFYNAVVDFWNTQADLVELYMRAGCLEGNNETCSVSSVEGGSELVGVARTAEVRYNSMQDAYINSLLSGCVGIGEAMKGENGN